MAFKSGSADRLALTVGARAALIGVSGFLICNLLWPGRHYVTAVFVGLCAVGLGVSMARSLRRAQRTVDGQLRRLAAEYGQASGRLAAGTAAGAGVGARAGAGAGAGASGGVSAGADAGGGAGARAAAVAGPDAADGVSAFDQAAGALGAARAERQQQLEYVQALLDTVTAALIVVKDDGRVELVNRSARTLAGAPVTRLEEIKAVGAETARELLSLAPGTRRVLDLPQGRQVFVSVSQLSSPRHGRRRMLSLHAIAGELDAVELNAWKDMAGVLAHEIMNSLTAISSLSESLGVLLRQGNESREAEAALESIQRRSLGLLDFVGRYRLIMDMPAPRMQSLRLDELLAGIERLLGQRFRERGILFSRSVEPPDLTGRADPQLLEQALINLLKNSIEACSDAPQPRVAVTCQLREGSLVLAVADNGRGLTAPGSEQGGVPVFTTRSGGSGIGLHLVRQIASSHGGQLEARPNPPNGSVFTLILPFSAG
jgi:two-component system nitrogen regulation sensor histidine kinase NtrY